MSSNPWVEHRRLTEAEKQERRNRWSIRAIDFFRAEYEKAKKPSARLEALTKLRTTLNTIGELK